MNRTLLYLSILMIPDCKRRSNGEIYTTVGELVKLYQACKPTQYGAAVESETNFRSTKMRGGGFMSQHASVECTCWSRNNRLQM